MTMAMVLWLIFLGLATAGLGWAQPSSDPCIERGLVTSLGQKLTKRYVLRSDDPTVPIRQPQAAHMQVRIVVEEVGSCPWRLVLRDRAFRAIQTLDAQSQMPGSPVWSRRITGDTIFLDLTDCVGGVWPKIVSDQQVWMPEYSPAPFYSTKTPNVSTWISLEDSQSRADKRLGDLVGFLVGLGADATRNWGCSGVMVGPDLFLTNWHCLTPLPDQSTASLQSLTIDMGWDKDTLSRDYQVVALEEKSSDLDFAILRVRPLTALGPARYTRLPTAAPVEGPVRIVHHPAGLRKQISSECGIQDINFPAESSLFLSHDCDTESGSSGAPLFDDQQRVVGLHHCGFASNATVKVNRAVRIDQILLLVRQRNLSLYERLTR